MHKLVTFTVTVAIVIGMISGCGPSEEEIKKREQARQDSLEQVRQQQLQQQRQDSIAQARQDSIAAAKKKEEERNQIEFDEDGSFAVQVEAWRSEVKAQNQIQKWKDRGFENAYVVKYGNEDTGNIWFRVRLGRFATKEMSEKFQAQLMEDYNANSWISLLDNS